MRIFLKIVLLVAVVLLVVSYEGKTDQRTKAERSASYIGRTGTHINENSALPRDFRERRPDSIMRRDILQREMRGNVPPPDLEEIRRQRNIERSANTEWLRESTKRYSPDSWYLLMSYDSLPASSQAPLLNGGVVTSQKTTETFEYLRGRTRIDLLASMELNVHELAHAYFDQNVFQYLIENNIGFNPDNANGFIYISPYQSYFISFPLKAMFPSAELAAVIPSNLRTYRYDTYINGTTSTQSDGVIGLLNELHAYYCGTRYCFDMLEPYKTAAGSDASGLFEWVTHTQSTMSAFYEFNFFISEYLLFMKRKHPADYELLRSYRPFRESYVTLKKLYKDLIDRYLDRINKEAGLLNASGESQARLSDGWLWIRSGKSHISSGTPLFSDERKILLPVLEGRRYREIRDDFEMN